MMQIHAISQSQVIKRRGQSRKFIKEISQNTVDYFNPLYGKNVCKTVSFNTTGAYYVKT